MNLYQKYLAKAQKYNIPTEDLMFFEYKKFIRKATNDRTIEFLKAMQPARLQVIRDTMQQLDKYFNRKDYHNFMDVINKSLEILKQDIY
jgi:hypothetical protein